MATVRNKDIIYNTIMSVSESVGGTLTWTCGEKTSPSNLFKALAPFFVSEGVTFREVSCKVLRSFDRVPDTAESVSNPVVFIAPRPRVCLPVWGRPPRNSLIAVGRFRQGPPDYMWQRAIQEQISELDPLGRCTQTYLEGNRIPGQGRLRLPTSSRTVVTSSSPWNDSHVFFHSWDTIYQLLGSLGKWLVCRVEHIF